MSMQNINLNSFHQPIEKIDPKESKAADKLNTREFVKRLDFLSRSSGPKSLNRSKNPIQRKMQKINSLKNKVNHSIQGATTLPKSRQIITNPWLSLALKPSSNYIDPVEILMNQLRQTDVWTPPVAPHTTSADRVYLSFGQ